MIFARAIAEIHRRDGGHIVAGLIRRLGSFELAEEALQNAYARADLLRRAGREMESLAAYDRALALVKNTAEREYLLRRRREISSAIA